MPEHLEGKGWAMSLDTEKARLASELAGSLTGEQKAQVRVLVESKRPSGLDPSTADRAPADLLGEKGSFDKLASRVGEVVSWQTTVSSEPSKVLTT